MNINRNLFTKLGNRLSPAKMISDPLWLEVLGGAAMGIVLAAMLAFSI